MIRTVLVAAIAGLAYNGSIGPKLAAALVGLILAIPLLLRALGPRITDGVRDKSKPLEAVSPSSDVARRRLGGKQVLVVSGTKGIGAAFAQVLAACSANVCIVGRSRGEAETVLAELQKANPTGKHEFIAADLSSVVGCLALAAEFKRGHSKLDLLVFTVGILGGDQRHTTRDGLEREFQLNFFCRFVVANELAPLMDAAAGESKDAKEGAPRPRILNIATAGVRMGKLDLSDLQWEKRKPFKGLGQHAQTVILNDLFVIEWTKRHPRVDAIGLNPGLVPTDIRTNELITGGLARWFVEKVMVANMGRTAKELSSTTLLAAAVSPSLQSGALVGSAGHRLVPDEERAPAVAQMAWDQCSGLLAQLRVRFGSGQ